MLTLPRADGPSWVATVSIYVSRMVIAAFHGRLSFAGNWALWCASGEIDRDGSRLPFLRGYDSYDYLPQGPGVRWAKQAACSTICLAENLVGSQT